MYLRVHWTYDASVETLTPADLVAQAIQKPRLRGWIR
jgi:hypothetical protein